MKFYIVTPSFNAIAWLPACVRSVADQVCEGVEVHHHIQDGGSHDGTAEWLHQWQKTHAHTPGYRFTFESAPDGGMYAAINKGWANMPYDADVTAHLNGDEQYMPGALKILADCFTSHPKTEIITTGFFVFDEKGRYLCHRRPMVPDFYTGRFRCAMNTCTTFHRVKPFLRHGVRFDETYRAAGDIVFFRDLLALKPRIKMLPSLLSTAFFITGNNLGWTHTFDVEYARVTAGVPKWLLKSRRLICKGFGLMMMISDWFCKPPREFDVYRGNAEHRETRPIRRPRIIWQDRREGEDI